MKLMIINDIGYSNTNISLINRDYFKVKEKGKINYDFNNNEINIKLMKKQI